MNVLGISEVIEVLSITHIFLTSGSRYGNVSF
jgi:hypothetical protein